MFTVYLKKMLCRHCFGQGFYYCIIYDVGRALFLCYYFKKRNEVSMMMIAENQLRRGVVIFSITTFIQKKPKARFCAGSNPDGNLWYWSWRNQKFNSFCWLTILWKEIITDQAFYVRLQNIFSQNIGRFIEKHLR